jgi:hypothetical protein
VPDVDTYKQEAGEKGTKISAMKFSSSPFAATSCLFGQRENGERARRTRKQQFSIRSCTLELGMLCERWRCSFHSTFFSPLALSGAR